MSKKDKDKSKKLPAAVQPKRTLDEILQGGLPDARNSVQELLSRPGVSVGQAAGFGLGKSQPAESFAGRVQADDPYKDLPPVPPQTAQERRSRVLLNNTLSEEMYKMIGAWLVIEQVEDGKTDIDDEVAALNQRFIKGENTAIVYHDAWTLGTPLVDKLLKAARRNDNGVELEQQLAFVYSQCKFDDTWEAPEAERFQHFLDTVEPILRAVVPEDITLAKKLAFQQFSEEDCAMFRRVSAAVHSNNPIAAWGGGDRDSLMHNANMITAFHPVSDELRAEIPRVFRKLLSGEKLNAEDMQSFDAAIATALSEPSLTKAECDIIEKKPDIRNFADFVVQVGFSRFGDLMMASNMLQGRADNQGQHFPGANELYGNYLELTAAQATYAERADTHRQSLESFERSLKYLVEVRKKFDPEKGLVSDIPQPNPDVLEKAHQNILQPMHRLSDNKGPLYYLRKAYEKPCNKSLPRNLKDRCEALVNVLGNIPAHRNRSADAYKELFDDSVKGLVSTLRGKQQSGEPYDAIDTRHQELIFALQEMQASLKKDLRITSRGMQTAIADERASEAGNKIYMDFLEALEKAASQMHEELQAREKIVAGAVSSLLSSEVRGLKDGMTFDDVSAARAAGQPTEQFFEGKMTPIDDMAKASIAAEHIVNHAQTIVDVMKKRQTVLDQYAAKETELQRRSGGGGGAVGGGR